MNYNISTKWDNKFQKYTLHINKPPLHHTTRASTSFGGSSSIKLIATFSLTYVCNWTLILCSAKYVHSFKLSYCIYYVQIIYY